MGKGIQGGNRKGSENQSLASPFYELCDITTFA